MTTSVITDNTSGGNFTGITDTYISSSFPFNNFGTDTRIGVAAYSIGNSAHGLIKAAGLNSTNITDAISSANLQLYVDSDIAGDGDVIELYRLLRNWTDVDATDHRYDASNNWTTQGGTDPGTDISATLTASVTVNAAHANSYVTFSSAQLATDCENMRNGTVPNYGWLIIRNPDPNTDNHYKYFRATEGTDGQRPKLTVIHGPADVSITPSAGALALTGVAPTVTVPVTRTPTVGALSLSGNAPSVTQLGTLQPGTASLTMTGSAASVQSTLTITPNAGSLAFTGYISPQVLSVPPPTAAELMLTGIAPAIAISGARQPVVGALAFTGVAPTLINGAGRVPSVGALTLTGVAPQVSNIGTIQPVVGALVLTGVAPGVFAAPNIAPAAGSLSLSGSSPRLSLGILTPSTGSLTFGSDAAGTGSRPSVNESNPNVSMPGFGPSRRFKHWH